MLFQFYFKKEDKFIFKNSQLYFFFHNDNNLFSIKIPAWVCLTLCSNSVLFFLKDFSKKEDFLLFIKLFSDRSRSKFIHSSLEIRGIEFKIESKPQNRIIFYLGNSHPVFVQFSNKVFLHSFNAKSIALNGFFNSFIGNIFTKIKAQKKWNAYKEKGVFIPCFKNTFSRKKSI
uniref:Ribosomal protein L6 n=1 Tax=Thraustochytrium aureum TaxID=42467 RepID=Q9G4E2_9STRA|nr:ribosomal protein L6 [Thraustochytrium aureum]